MAKHTQTIRREIASKLFECVWLFFGVGAWRVETNFAVTQKPADWYAVLNYLLSS